MKTLFPVMAITGISSRNWRKTEVNATIPRQVPLFKDWCMCENASHGQ